MRTVIYAIPALLAVLVLSPGPARANPPAYVTLDYGTSYALPPTVNERAVRIPLSMVEDVNFDLLVFEILDARFKEARSPALLDALSYKRQPAKDGKGAALILKFSDEYDLETGTYRIDVAVRKEIQPKDTKAKGGGEGAQDEGKPGVQLLKLSIVQPAAEFGPPGTLVVDRTCALGRTSDISQLFTLRETGKDAPATGVTITPIKSLTTDGKPVTGSICFTSPGTVAAGGTEEIPYALVGEFPLGTTKVTAELDAPQLANKMEILVDVRTRRHPGWIVVLIGLGVLAGFLLRIYLQGRISFLAAKIQTSDLVDQLNAQALAYKDEKLQKAIQKLKDDVRAALVAKDATRLQELATNGPGEISGVVDALNTRATEVADKLDALHPAFARPWIVPPAVQEALERRGADFEIAVVGFDRGEPEPTRQECRGIEEATRKDLSGAVHAWRKDSGSAIADQKAAKSPMAQFIEREVTDVSEDPVAKMKPIDVFDEAKDLGAIVKEIHDARDEELTYVLNWMRGLRSNLKELLRKFAEAADAPRAEMNALRASTQAFWSRVQDLPDAPAQSLRVYLEVEGDLHRDLAAVVEGVGSNPDVTDKLGKGQYEQALAAAIQHKKTKKGATLGARKAADAASLQPQLGNVRKTTKGRAASRGRRGRTERQPINLRLMLDRAETAKELFRAKGLQTIGYGLLIAAGGFALYYGSFVGKPLEMAKILFWAFAVDLSADAITTLGTQIKTKT